ncbi:MAG: SH3 domain-containing protein [Clostridia bacterium]|nr:SH3 domain-containing protein [Clostridia bacterium]
MTDNYLIYPCKIMRITQSYSGKTSHKPHTVGSLKDYPIDEGCADMGRCYIYCPCDKMKVKRIYGVGTKGTNTLWLESTDKVSFADGTRDFFTMLITHPDDSDLAKIKVGDIYARYEPICREGKDGASAYHFHISCGKGKMTGNGWVKNTKGKWVLTTSNGAFRPQQLFYIDPDFTKVISSASLKFKPLPESYTAGYYKVNTAVLNVRSGAGTGYKKTGTLLKGKKLSITQIKGNWGSFAKNKWVCLDYCEAVK